MKIIHCADLHLDSVMNTHLTPDKARERKAELLNTFCNMVRYGEENAVGAIIIAGDLYDKKTISATARNTVLHEIVNHPDIIFYYLRGNHDSESLLGGMEKLPDNLKLFDEEWTSYTLCNDEDGRVVITGVELTSDNSAGIYNSLVLNTDDFNIVVLHGQETEASGRDKAETINIRSLKGHGIDYLALGHIHTYKEERLDARGVYCYPGCLEGRGFDECGEHGFVVLDIDVVNRSFTREFVPIAHRTLHTLEVDITGCIDSMEISDRIAEKINKSDISENNLVKILLTGSIDVECEKNEELLLKKFENDFYYVKLKDESGYVIDYDEFMYDESLKGEFVRTVKADTELNDEEKAEVIRYGILALKGEELQ